MQFFFEVLIGGLLSGVMYSLVALGFVLIYKASGVFNFAQGAMVFFAALTFVGLEKWALPFWLALRADLVAMVVLGIATEKIVLRPLVNQPQITLFMATIGLTFFIEGLAQAMWGASVRGLDLGIQDEPIEWMLDNATWSSPSSTSRRRVAAVLVTVLACSSTEDPDRPRAARGRRRPPGRAVDRHPAAAHLGIVWAVAGFVALVAGCCGARATACSSR
jgi:branched-chain amino acid transport system permease protein